MAESELRDALRGDRNLFETLWSDYLEGRSACNACPMCHDDERYGLLCRLDEDEGTLFIVRDGDDTCDVYAEEIEEAASHWRAVDALEDGDAEFDARSGR